MPANVDLNIDIETKDSGTEAAAAKLETLANAADNAQDQLEQLDRKLVETRIAMAAAGKTFQETGDISPLKALIKDERQLSSVKTSVEKGMNEIDNVIFSSGQKGGKGFISKLTGSINEGLTAISSSPPQGLTQWLVGAAVVASPAIAAALSVAVLGGLGTAGIAGGLVAVASDPRVKSAFVDLGGTIADTFQKAANSFVGPTVVAVGIIKSEFTKLGPALQKDFDALAPSLTRLATGISGFIDKLQTHGLGQAFEAARPVIDALASEMPGLGESIGTFFREIAGGKDGAIQFLHDLIRFTDVALVWVGGLTEGFTKLYDLLRNNPIGQVVSGGAFTLLDAFGPKAQNAKKSLAELNAEGYQSTRVMNQIGSDAERAGLGVSLAADDFKKLSAQINATRSDSDALAASMVDKLISTSLSLDHATLGVAEAQRSLAESLKQNIDAHNRHKAATDIDTQAGQANREAILSAVSANLTNYDAMIKVGFSAKDASDAYNTNTRALEKQLWQAGLTGAQIDGLIGKYRNVPANVDTNIVMKGLADAISGLDETLRRINGLPPRKDIDVVTHFSTTGSAPVLNGPAVRDFKHGGIMAAATGLITSSPTVLFGERGTGQEAYIPRLGISQSRGLSLANTAAGWHGGMVVPKRSVARGGGAAVSIGFDAEPGTLEHAILSMIRAHVTNIGGSVQAALGRRGH